MLNLHDSQSQVLAFGTGVLLHTTVYRRGEWDLFVPKLSCFYAFLWLFLVGWDQPKSSQSQNSFSAAMKVVTWLGTCHVLGITLSMVVYRLCFHRLRSFHGPFWGRISNLYLTFLTAKELHLYSEVESLHQKYGDIVRVGE